MFLRDYNVGLRPIDSLHPYENNPRIHDDKIGQGAEIIRRFGFRVPILADKTGLIADGVFRWKVAHYLKMKLVPVIPSDDMSADDIRAFRIAVNKMADLADWDDEKLAIEVKDLMDHGFNNIPALGFSDSELNGIMKSFTTEVPEINTPKFQGEKKSIGGDRFLLMLEFPNENALQEMYDEMTGRNVSVKVLS